MDKSDIKELHYITPIDNVPSILKKGILPHNKALKFTHCDISETGVQERRAVKKIPGTNKNLHDYANLYFDAHNPMLSKRRTENDRICILRVTNSVLDVEGVIITDTNAARDCWFKTVDEGLPLLNENEIYDTFWIHDDPIKKYRHEGIKCAEVLVPYYIPPNLILGAYVSNDMAYKKICSILGINAIIKIEIKTDMFF